MGHLSVGLLVYEDVVGKVHIRYRNNHETSTNPNAEVLAVPAQVLSFIYRNK